MDRKGETGFDGDETAGKLLWKRDESSEHGYVRMDGITITPSDGDLKTATNNDETTRIYHSS